MKMYQTANSFCLICLLSSVLNCYCTENFAIVFSTHKEIQLQNSIKSREAEKVASFPGLVTALALYQDYVYVALFKGESEENLSTVWRSKLKDLSAEQDESWDQFIPDVHNNVVSCMVGAKGFIFIGFNSGSIMRRPLYLNHNWYPLHRGSLPITGIDYSYKDNKIYASLVPGLILRCSIEENGCKEVHPTINGRLRSLKVGFGALWIGADESELWKCPLGRDQKKNILDCYSVYKYNIVGTEIVSIRATSKYLYVNADLSTKITRCDPYKQSKPCKSVLAKADSGMDQFVTIKNAAGHQRKCTIL